MPSISVRIAELMPTRPCDFCLAFQNDSVFADFAIDSSDKVYLSRISYDGYGCNNTDNIEKMNIVDSEVLIDAVKRDTINDPTIISIISKYFDENKELLWKDALLDHELLPCC